MGISQINKSFNIEPQNHQVSYKNQNPNSPKKKTHIKKHQKN